MVSDRQKLLFFFCFVFAAAWMPFGCHSGEDHQSNGESEYESNGIDIPAPIVGLSHEMIELAQAIEMGYSDAVRLQLQGVLLRNPENYEAHFLYGLSFHRELRYGRAQPHFERAIELAPTFALAHYFYGWCMYYLGELDVSREAFEARLALQGDYADAHFAIGLIELDEGNSNAAEGRFRKAIELETSLDEGPDPADLSKFYARLGESLDRQGQREEARRSLEISTSLYPDHYEAHYLLYRVLMRLGDEDAAEDALKAHDAAKQRVRPELMTPDEE